MQDTINKIEELIRQRKAVADRLKRCRQCADIGRTAGFYVHPIAHQGHNVQIATQDMADAVARFADLLVDQLATLDRKLMAVGAIVEVVNHVE